MNADSRAVRSLGMWAGVLVLSGAALAQQYGEFKVLRPGIGEQVFVPGPGDDAVEPIRQPRLPLDMYPAEAMGSIKTPPVNSGPGAPVYHDLRTGQNSVFPEFDLVDQVIETQEAIGSLAPPGLIRGEQADSYGRNMGNLSYISNQQDWPWRANCRIFMEWYDGNGNLTRSSSCSGTLIDSRMILTAGHCTFNWSDGAGWCDEVFVYPAYENGEDPDNLYGYSTAAGIWGWTGWTENQDWDHDMSWVVLDRPAGALTGWFGYGYSNDCDFYTNDNTWNNASYPAESDYGWNGCCLYYRSGTFDGCFDNYQLEYYRAAYGGMSGSSGYRIVDDDRYAHNVASRSNRTDWTSHTRFSQDKFEWVRDTRIPGDTPNTVDYWPLWVRGDTQVNAGELLSSFHYFCHNYSEANVNDTVCADLYLSTNDNISESDTQLGTLCFGWVTGPKGTAYLDYPNLVGLPKNLASGTYWVGVITTNADANAANNDTDGQDALQISYTARPDLVVANVDAENGIQNHGWTMDVDYSIRNEGGTSSSGYTVEIRASPNTTISAADPLLKTVNHNSISAGQTENWTTGVVIPDTLAPGYYYIGVIVSSNSTESYTSNNTGYDPDTVAVTDLPDMDVISVDATDGTYDQGESIPVAYSIKNIGSETITEEFTLEFYLSTNTTISAADTLIKTIGFRADLDPGESFSSNTSGVVPVSTPDGLYYVGMIVTDVFLEADTTNNTGYDRVRVTIGDDCAADFDGNGTVNIFDFLAFQTAYSDGDMSADVDGNGLLNIFDFLAFQTLYGEGC